MNKFFIENKAEIRSDNSDMIGYRVHWNEMIYVMYYDKDDLREVYFIDFFPCYFMSCRTDFQTISHYYIYDNFIKRYENGALNRFYLIVNTDTLMCYKNKNKDRVIYQRVETPLRHEVQKIKNDLLSFLRTFDKKNFYQLFSPKEPIK